MLESFSQLSLAKEDITTAYFAACHDELELGELVRLPEFSLQDSIAALEIMDAKMDSGLMTSEQQEQLSYDCSTPHPPDGILAIMDRLFASEMTWQSGSSLLQTLYTCVYFEKNLGMGPGLARLSRTGETNETLKRLLDDVLSPYVATTIKCTLHAREEFQRAHLYEEEDIVTNDFTMRLSLDIPDDLLIERLVTGQAFLKGLEHPSDEHTSTYKQIRLRLQLRVAFLSVLRRLDDPQAWNEGLESVRLILASIVPSTRDPVDVDKIFTTKIQRMLISTSPPRPMVNTPVKTAFANFERVCTDLRRISENIEYAAASPSCMVGVINVFCRDDPLPLPLIRACLKNLALDSMGLTEMSADRKWMFLLTAIEEVCVSRNILFQAHYILSEHRPVEGLEDAHYHVRQTIESTLEQMAHSYSIFFESLCDNPSRQRRNLCKMLVNLDRLQDICQGCDDVLDDFMRTQSRLSNARIGSPMTRTLSSWVASTKLETSSSILLLGFETDLYLPFEWHMIYWLLQFVLRLHLAELRRLSANTTAADAKLMAQIEHRAASVTNMTLLCEAYMSLLAALEAAKVIRRPHLEFSSEELLYAHRMAPFTCLQDLKSVTFHEYKTSSSHGTASVTDLLQHSKIKFQAAKGQLLALNKRGASPIFQPVPILVTQFQTDVKALVRCCITHSLLIDKLQRFTAEEFRGKSMAWDGTQHRHFPIISIV